MLRIEKKTGWFTPDRIFLDSNLESLRDHFFVKDEIENQEIFNLEYLELLFNSYKKDGYLLKKEITTIILFQIWYNKVLSLK